MSAAIVSDDAPTVPDDDVAGSTSAVTAPQHRIRCRYTKHGKIRFLGHRDVARCWERSIRRAGLPVVYSEGFSPRPRLHFGLALSVGCESEAEYIDIDVIGEIDHADARQRLTEGMPPGIDVTDVIDVSRRATALQAVVASTTWKVELIDTDRTALVAAIESVRGSDERIISVVRKGRDVDIDVTRQVLSLDIVEGEDPGSLGLLIELSTDGRSLRLAEFFTSFTPPLEARRVVRLEQWAHLEDRRLTPLECDRPSPSPT